jgi:hypothetical protein
MKIFLCHKKILTPQQGGHKVEQPNDKATILNQILKQRHDVWIDEAAIAAGMAWETEIYSHLLVSDVLLVAVGPGTSNSEWVRREIALAKALGIAIVPLGYDLTPEGFGNELKGLHIEHIQGKLTQNIKFAANDALLHEIDADLRLACERTGIEQTKTLAILAARRSVAAPKAEDKQRAFSVDVRFGNSSIRLIVASGDLTKTRGIDVIVNSENDYMQMARVFETRTVSSLLRRGGSSIAADGKYIDTIQQELDFQLRDRSRPVQPAEVFITSAGGPRSQLATVNKVRYLFHVAAVQAVAAEARVVPFKQPDQIEECMRSCFAKFGELNQSKGVISPPSTPQRQLQEQLAGNNNGTSKSILFPLFGTGQGGTSAEEAIGPMLAGFRRFFEDPDNSSVATDLKDIYFAAFTVADVEVIKAEIGRAFA